MKKNGFINTFRSAFLDTERPLSERVALVLTFIAEPGVIIAMIANLITKEDVRELIVLATTAVFLPAVTAIGLYRNKVKVATGFIAAALVFFIIPGLTVFGGGVHGGGVFWVVFGFMYVGLVTKGKPQKFLMVALFLLTVACYAVEYYYPELIDLHPREQAYVDAFVSLVLVSIVCFAMIVLQTRLFNDENKRAKKEAERAEELSRAQNRFFSSMSHEIRTPINSILGLNELILRDGSASDEVAKNAAGIQGAGKMLLTVINDILDFSKMEAGSMDIVPVDYRTGDLISEVVNMIWLRAHDKGIKFDVSIDPKVPSVLYGDEVRIKQIIINLLNNAVKYTTEGSIELHMESDEIDEKTVLLTISVSDTGMGIKKESLPYLFDAFKRVDEEKNRYVEGTGLGLSIVRTLLDLMGGNITVNSVYGEGTTFTVVVKQGISDATEIGELNIHNQRISKRAAYESSFSAPEASILIVDDNEMNLEVESKLLSGTGMAIDKAISGKAALEFAVKKHYDAILMDHLMPEMDGIECLMELRNQTGGLNRTTPVIVLTANAGGDNKELYNRAGFDGYLVKPVSGENLEAMLVKHISRDKLILKNKVMSSDEDINASAGYSGKAPVLITSSTLCDLPDSIVKKLNLPLIPALIYTEDGVFKDGVQMDAEELIRYIDTGKTARSTSPDEAGYTAFFAAELKKAHHLIHIALTSSMSDDYRMACEAAKAFDNVTVINSECLSSAAGLLVLIAYKLAQQNIPVDKIIEELDAVKSRLKCSFVIDTTEYMAKKGHISDRMNRLAKALSLHPTIRCKNNKSGIGGLWLGNTKRAYRRYIHNAFPVDIIPDPEVVFITYVNIPMDTLLWIKEEVSKLAYFENVVFQQASAAISSNCGTGTFGILYFVKGNKSYNIGSLISEESELADAEENVDYDETDDSPELLTPDRHEEAEDAGPEDGSSGNEESVQWYSGIEGIDADAAIRNSGSSDTLKTVMKIFYDSIPAKSEEIEGFYSSEDWQDYTIKVHALKSSAKLIGATAFAERAQLLENAGKEENVGYIKANHAAFMKDYLKYSEILGPVFGADTDGGGQENNRPVADEFLMNSVFEGLRDAAKTMDCDAIEQIMGEIANYAIPDDMAEKFRAVREKADSYDYDGMLELLGE
ncbi:MAG: DegV family EDD domain-containing protein [Lachnospiraceae bacterium]|nr:DegV family EDD domain-containing protein [Lachnospiraceae bacterium]